MAAQGKSATGLLAACATMAGISNMFVASLDGFITSKAAHASAPAESPDSSASSAPPPSCFAPCWARSACCWSPWAGLLVRFVYGADYSGAGPVVAVLAIGIFVNAIGNNAGRGLWVIERPRANMIPDICSLVVTFVVLFCLLSWGPLGAADRHPGRQCGRLHHAILGPRGSFEDHQAQVGGGLVCHPRSSCRLLG